MQLVFFFLAYTFCLLGPVAVVTIEHGHGQREAVVHPTRHYTQRPHWLTCISKLLTVKRHGRTLQLFRIILTQQVC